MKKFGVLSFVVILILAFGATVYGQEKAPALEFKPFGFLDAQTLYYVNVTGGNATAGIYSAWGLAAATSFDAAGNPTATLDRKAAYLESRARLGFNMIMGKEVSGTILFEMDSNPWGSGDGTRNSFGFWAADRAAVEIKNVYIDFAVPGIPVPITMRVGAQGLGYRPAVLMATDGMGISAGIKLGDQVLIAPFWAKALENNNVKPDDVDIYGLRAQATLGSLTIGAYGLYFNMNTYPIVTANTNDAGIGWYGLYADGKVGPVNLNFDFVYDNGKVEAAADAAPKVKYSGWATRVAVDYPIEKLNIGLAGAYGSGADTRKTSTTGLPGANPSNPGTNSSKVGSYIIPPGSESAAAFGESVVFFSSGVNRGDSGIASNLNYTQVCRGGLGGLWYAKLYAGLKVIPEYKVTFQGLYIGDTTKNGSTFGNARKAPFGAGNLKDDNGIGFEVDLINEIQIYKNLKYTIAGGYLFAGKALDLYTGVAGVGNFEPKNPWQLTTNLTYNF
jgi:hypothetical protein